MSKGHSKKQPTRGFSLQQALWQKLKLGLAAGNLLLVLKLLKDARLPLDSPDPVNGWPCLFYAIRYHQPGVLSHFLSHHLRLDVKITTDFQRNSALVIAADVQNDAAFKEILQQSPCPIELMALKNLCGKNALHIAIERGNTGMVKMLLEKGMEIQEPLGDGSTPLHMFVFVS